MLDLLTWPTPHRWMMAFTSGALIYGLRYLVFAGLAGSVARPTQGGGIGRPHVNAPATLDLFANVRRELAYSAVTVLAFGFINAVLIGTHLIHSTRLYYRIDAYPLWWFWLSIVVMLLLHDTLFYWMHRAMHTRALYRAMHRVHHRSIYPTAFAAYSFQPAEAAGEALIVVAIIFLVPSHPLAFVIFQTLSTAYNVYGHCGREFYPRRCASHPILRWLNTSTAHAEHHAHGRHNFGLYFLFWDRAMGTLDPAYR